MADSQNRNEPDARKGAVEGDGRAPTEPGRSGNTSMAGQNPHRTESNLIKSNDSDFPEPGGNPEHSGQKVEKSGQLERDPVDQDPGHRQEQNQSDEKDDPLAA